MSIISSYVALLVLVQCLASEMKEIYMFELLFSGKFGCLL